MSLLLLNEDELRQAITMTEAIEAVKNALAVSTQEKTNTPGSFVLSLPEVKGKVNVDGAYLTDASYYAIKINSHFRDNPNIGLPTAGGLLAIFDAATGFPVAILIDNGYLASVRSGAVGALAAEHLARRDVKKVAVIGSGRQAYMQLKSLADVRRFNSVSVWDASPFDANLYVSHMIDDYNLDIQIASSLEEAVKNADVVIVAAPIQPLIQAKWLKAGVHLTTVLIDPGHTRQRLQFQILQQADIIVVDDLRQCLQVGEISHALKAKAVSQDCVHGSLSNLISQKIRGRSYNDQITIADLSGLGGYDNALATLAVNKALFLGLGQRLEIGLGQKELGLGLGSLL